MAKTFEEVFNEIKANVSVSKKGKQVKSFSRSDFNDLAKALVNTPAYTFQTASMNSEGVVETKDVKPVEDFRGVIRRVLQDFGVDKQESERVMTDAYEFKNVDGLYSLCAELIYKYCEAGKKFDFPTRPDFQGSILLNELGTSKSKHKNIQTGEEFEVEKQPHKTLKVKSKTPKWLKKRL